MTNSFVLLGSTGSIGTQVLDVVRGDSGRFAVVGLSAGKNIRLLAQQIVEFKPHYVSIQDESDRSKLLTLLKLEGFDFQGELFCGHEGLLNLATVSESSMVVLGLVGLIGLMPSLAALRSGKRLLTANKETFVAAGHLVKPYLSQIVTLDSEHSGIFQCLQAANQPREVSKLYLTASGGPFRTFTLEELASVTPAQALKHPKWTMGPKISIDSATLMNKGLEVIEAHWLFDIAIDKISVLVHPESIIHGGLQFIDGSVLLQLGVTDMRGPIQYALSYPERHAACDSSLMLGLEGLSQLNLEAPDYERFPCLRLAYHAGRMGGGATTVLNGANEVLVQQFLDAKITFLQIPQLLELALERYQKDHCIDSPDLDQVFDLDHWARQFIHSSLDKQFSLSGI